MEGDGQDKRRKRLVLVTCILASAIVGLDGTMVTVALPDLADGLGAGLAAQQWVVAAFLLTLGALLLLGGSLGDAYDRWRVFMVGAAGFGVATLVSTLAPNVPILILGRLLQGVAAALLLPGVLAIINSTFEGEEQQKAIGTWTAYSGLSMVAGPALGGALVAALSWRSVFGILVPLAALAFLLAIWAAPSATSNAGEASEDASQDEGGPVDWVGGALGVPAVGGPVFALIQGPEYGWTDPLILGAIAGGLVAAAGFVYWEHRAEDPMLPLGLFSSRAFSALNATTLVLYGALIASGTYTILFLQQVAGYGPIAAALAALTPITALLFFLSGSFGSLAERFGARPFVAGGSLVAGLGILLLLRVDAEASFLTVVLPSVAVHGLGVAMVVSPLTAGVLGAVDESRSGIASGVNNAVARIGSLLAIAVVGVAISAQFSANLDANLGAENLSSKARAAVEEASGQPLAAEPPSGLDPEERELLAGAFEEAAVGAFRLGVGVAGALALAAAVLGAVGMPGSRSGTESGEGNEGEGGEEAGRQFEADR